MHHPVDLSLDSVRKSLSDLIHYAQERNVQIAIENGNFQTVKQLLAEFDPEYLGFCYDSGHANIDETAFSHLDAMKNRLIAIHLNDNDGKISSQHRLPFSGTVDWKRLAFLIARSSYHKCMSLELNMNNSGIMDETAFLAKAFEAGRILSYMVTNASSTL
jgi:sugar phosphate isomerase/epimerase